MNRSFPRIAQHLNYSRQFLSPVSVRVKIPAGVPYEAYDSTGTKVQPWSLLSLFESIRAFMFWPIKRDDDPRPNGSLANFHEVLQTNFFFIANVSLSVSKEFHDYEQPKFPLYADATLKYVGTSSKCILTELYHPRSKDPYATCEVTDVLVASTTRRPTPYPDWFREEYASLCDGQRSQPLLSVDKPAENKILKNDWTVYLADTDSYLHANWGAYVKYSTESFNSNVLKGKYSNLSKTHINNGLKTMTVSYRNEVTLGDILTVESWEGKEENTIEFEGGKSGISCFIAKSEYYDK